LLRGANFITNRVQMAKYEKWLGASLGWMLTGNPIGGFLGFIAGSLIQQGEQERSAKAVKGVSEFEVNLMVLASHLMKIDGGISATEVEFTENFLNAHFEKQFATERAGILRHCLQKEYDLNAACGQIRMYSEQGTRVQVVRFLIDLAQCDSEMTERENYFIFRIAGYLNINDVDYRRLKAEHALPPVTVYETLGVTREMSFAEIRTVYRKLVLKYHPDRNKDAGEDEKKKLAQKFQQVQEAYEKIKYEREG
jgi:DnaJ like chaperone protein